MEPIKILLIEDNPGDARLIREILVEVNGNSFDLRCVESLSSGLEFLSKEKRDLILIDLSLPDSQGIETFKRIHMQSPRIPMIILTGLNNEDLAVRAVSEGAQDYLVKGQIEGNLLVRAIRYAIERKRISEEREKLILQLQEALAKVKTLSGFLPICASCKKIRDDKGYWNQIETYIRNHSEVEFSHAICPECMKKLYLEFTEDE